jgi:hypothetical protein
MITFHSNPPYNRELSNKQFLRLNWNVPKEAY